jgi:hypothetical protein
MCPGSETGEAVEIARLLILDCGGKRSATPLFGRLGPICPWSKSAVVAGALPAQSKA